MISHCPHCSGMLRFSDAHRQKVSQALETLAPGRTLKFACPRCKEPIELNKEGNASSFPQALESGKSVPTKLIPPRAPDISWLGSGALKESDLLEDVPTAMVLIPDPEIREKVSRGLGENQYQIHIPESVDQAIDSMRFKEYAVVVFCGEEDGTPLDEQDFHKFMMQMSMAKRRKIYYILVGASFHTLFDLEALTHSANLVVNTRETDHIPLLFKKGLKDYETLFSSYAATLKLHGKS
ncbi:MAG: hypothetical protein KKF12_16820 [Proteobacteria bacterium]|nr:hypothetical protein [Desulfobacula sp.]MBU4132480.1 hypothetical protein [Pseudomonadota bacterium]